MKPQSVLLYLLVFTAMIALNNTCHHEKDKLKAKPDIEKTIDTLRIIDKGYQAELKQYQKVNDSLKEKLLLTDSLLKKYKKEALPLQKKIKQIVQSNWDTIPEKAILEKCDSLKEMVIDYQLQQSITDSLTDEKICLLNQSITLKDELITKCDSSYQSMKQLLENSINENKICYEEVENLSKKNKRQLFFNKILGTITAVATIVTSTIIITNSK